VQARWAQALDLRSSTKYPQGLHCGSALRTDVSDNRRTSLAVALVYPLFATPTTGNSSRSQQQAFESNKVKIFPSLEIRFQSYFEQDTRAPTLRRQLPLPEDVLQTTVDLMHRTIELVDSDLI
jgi:hypothetical protein